MVQALTWRGCKTQFCSKWTPEHLLLLFELGIARDFCCSDAYGKFQTSSAAMDNTEGSLRHQWEDMCTRQGSDGASGHEGEGSPLDWDGAKFSALVAGLHLFAKDWPLVAALVGTTVGSAPCYS